MSQTPPPLPPRGANIKIIGVGGGGGNIVNTIVNATFENIGFIAANTDSQALQSSLASTLVQLGKDGLGAGADPEIGRLAAEESKELIAQAIGDADMLFVTAGLGGGTGTGAAPVVARIAREMGILTVGVVTRPFSFEGRQRAIKASEGLVRLKEAANATLVISNDRLLEHCAELSLEDAFREADSVLLGAVQGISRVVRDVGLVNPDFADLRTVMGFGGTVLMGTGQARGPHRAEEAAEMAMNSPFLDNTHIDGAQGVLINVIAGPGLGMREVNRAVGAINARVDEDALSIFGAVIDPSMGDSLHVMIVATGLPDPNRPAAPARRTQLPLSVPPVPHGRPSLFREPTAEVRPHSHPPIPPRLSRTDEEKDVEWNDFLPR